MTQKIGLIWSALLTLALAFLLYNQFNKTKVGESLSNQAILDTNSQVSPYRLAYVNSDSLVKGYMQHKGMQEKLEKKAMGLEKELERRTRIFQENYAILEKEAPNLSEAQLQSAQADLMQKQQELIQYRDSKAQELAQEEAELVQVLQSELDSVLTEVRDELKLDYVFSLNPSGALLKAAPAHDITNLVLDRLNNLHKNASSTKKAKIDDKK